MGCLMLPSHLTLFNAMERMSPLSHSHWEMYNLFLVKNCAFSLPSATKLRRLCFYRCVSVHKGGAITACIAVGIPAWLAAGLQGRGDGYPSMPCRFPGPHPRGKFRGICLEGSPGPHSRGKFRGICLGGLPLRGCACSRGCLLCGGCLLPGGVAPGGCCSRRGAALFCGLLLCPLLWPSGLVAF